MASSTVRVDNHSLIWASISAARSKRSPMTSRRRSASRSHSSIAMHSASHCCGLTATIEMSPSWHRYSATGCEDSPRRLPHRRFTVPLWVYIVTVHWCIEASASMALTSTTCPSPVRAAWMAAAAVPTAATAPCRYVSHGPPPCNGSRSTSPVRYRWPLAAQSPSGLERHAARGPSSPNPLSTVTTAAGLAALIRSTRAAASAGRPSWSSTTTSAHRSSSSAVSSSPGSVTTLRLPAPRYSHSRAHGTDASDVDERAGDAQRRSAGRLGDDDVTACRGEQPGAVGAGDAGRQVDDAQPPHGR